MLLFLGFALLAGAAYFVGEFATFSARERSDSLQRAATYGARAIPSIACSRSKASERS